MERARRSPHACDDHGRPVDQPAPDAGGVEIVARYITQVAEREELRAKLYQTAITLLGDSRVEPHLPASRPRAGQPT